MLIPFVPVNTLQGTAKKCHSTDPQIYIIKDVHSSNFFFFFGKSKKMRDHQDVQHCGSILVWPAFVVSTMLYTQ